jgi:hypothetical protein
MVFQARFDAANRQVNDQPVKACVGNDDVAAAAEDKDRQTTRARPGDG